MNSLPLILVIVASIFALGSVIALIISGFYGTAYQSKLSELEKHMRATSGETDDEQSGRTNNSTHP